MIKIIKSLEILENILCVYKNYLFYGKRSKLMIMIHIVFKFLYNLLVLLVYIFLKKIEPQRFNYKHSIFLTIHLAILYGDTFIVLYSLYKSEAYKTFITNLISIHKIYNNDVNYQMNLKRLQTMLFTICAALIIIAVSLNVQNTIYLLISFEDFPMLTILMTQSSIMYSEVCFILEYLVLYTFLSLLSNMLQSLNKTVLMMHEQIQKRETLVDSSSDLIEKVQQLAELYKCLVNLSKQLSPCFKYQVNNNIIKNYTSTSFITVKRVILFNLGLWCT